MAGDWKKQLRQIKRQLTKKEESAPTAPKRDSASPKRKSAPPKQDRMPEVVLKRSPAKNAAPAPARPPLQPRRKAKRPAPPPLPPTGPSAPAVQRQPDRPSLPDEPQGGAGKTFNIGIDFGTSTTKVCVRSLAKDAQVQVLSIDAEAQSGTRLCPSSVGVCEGQVFFGRQAEDVHRLRGGQIYRQLKVCLGCEVGIDPAVAPSWCQNLREPGSGRCSACFAVGRPDRQALASDLITLFLAWAMGSSRAALTRELEQRVVPRTTYSISAPIDQMDEGLELNGEYARIVFNAWRLSGGVRQGMPIDEALRWVAKAQSVEMPNVDDLLVELCPEGGAGIAGFALAPEMDEGLYCLVDIGAWTTEISFFRFSDVGVAQTGVPVRAFYASRSHRVAANEIDDRTREHLTTVYLRTIKDDPGLVEAIRDQRERRKFGDESLEPFLSKPRDVPKPTPLRLAQDTVAEGIFQSFMSTLKEAFQKEKSVGAWEGKLRLLFAGGGSKDAVLHQSIEHVFINGIEDVPPPSDLLGLPAADDYRHFLVAYGLAQGSQRWPRDLLPTQTLPFAPRVRRQRSFEEQGWGK